MNNMPIRSYDNARHPLRASLPVTRAPLLSREPLGDRQLFLMAFVAGFMAFYGLLS